MPLFQQVNMVPFNIDGNFASSLFSIYTTNHNDNQKKKKKIHLRGISIRIFSEKVVITCEYHFVSMMEGNKGLKVSSRHRNR